MLNAFVTKLYIFYIGFLSLLFTAHVLTSRGTPAIPRNIVWEKQFCIIFQYYLTKHMFLVEEYRITERRLEVKSGVFSLCTLSNKSSPSFPPLQISRLEFNCEVHTGFHSLTFTVTGNTSGQNRTQKPLVAVEGSHLKRREIPVALQTLG
jgi:hypothetical protein